MSALAGLQTASEAAGRTHSATLLPLKMTLPEPRRQVSQLLSLPSKVHHRRRTMLGKKYLERVNREVEQAKSHTVSIIDWHGAG